MRFDAVDAYSFNVLLFLEDCLRGGEGGPVTAFENVLLPSCGLVKLSSLRHFDFVIVDRTSIFLLIPLSLEDNLSCREKVVDDEAGVVAETLFR